MKLLSAAIVLGLALGVLSGQGTQRLPSTAAIDASVAARISAFAPPASASPGAAMPLQASLLRPLWKSAPERMAGEAQPAPGVRAARKSLPDPAAAAPLRSEGGGWTILLAALVAMAFVARRRIPR